jgi:ribosomal-protein-alanine N-acetyltransferase
MLNSMEVICQSERLLLREFIPQDANEMFRLNADPKVIQFTGDSPFKSIEEAKEFIRTYDYSLHGFGRWAVIRKKDKAWIGWCGLKQNEEAEIDVGFRFHQKFWNEGFATEAAEAAINHAFNVLELDTIVGRAASENQASIRVLRKIGMRFKCKATCHGIPNALVFEIHNPKANPTFASQTNPWPKAYK